MRTLSGRSFRSIFSTMSSVLRATALSRHRNDVVGLARLDQRADMGGPALKRFLFLSEIVVNVIGPDDAARHVGQDRFGGVAIDPQPRQSGSQRSPQIVVRPRL